MSIFVYADESGVFDLKGRDTIFVFGGLIFLNKAAKDHAQRMYKRAERDLGPDAGCTPSGELKATTLSNVDKGKLFRSLNRVHKFAVIVRMTEIRPEIFDHKKSKQRYLDYAFKIGLKRALEQLIKSGHIDPENPGALHLEMDEHNTATDGRYELREALAQEFKVGTFNWNYQAFFPPILPGLLGVDVKFVDSEKTPLVRAADIVANKVFFLARTRQLREARKKVSLILLP